MSDETATHARPYQGTMGQWHFSNGTFMNDAEVAHWKNTGVEQQLPAPPVDETEDEPETDKPEPTRTMNDGRMSDLEAQVEAILVEASGYFDSVREKLSDVFAEIKAEAAAVMAARQAVLDAVEKLQTNGFIAKPIAAKHIAAKPTIPIAPTGKRRGRPPGSKNAVKPSTGLNPRIEDRLAAAGHLDTVATHLSQ